MDIKFANRLAELRRKHNYSQEELADKLGVSRQAISKWERGEASPDTDNLIALAKLYKISIDELIDKENKKQNVHIGLSGIHVDDGKSKVDIGWNGIHVEDGAEKIHINKNYKFKYTNNKYNKVNAALFSLVTIVYIVLGIVYDLWYNMWILFFVPEIIVSLCRAISQKNPNKFNITFLCCFAYFFMGMVYPVGLWHPSWVIFLLIPAYYSLISIFKKEDEDKIIIDGETIENGVGENININLGKKDKEEK